MLRLLDLEELLESTGIINSQTDGMSFVKQLVGCLEKNLDNELRSDMSSWKDVEKKHVITAIQKYDEEGIEAYSRNTFLVYDNAWYPAKHIRAMAYEIAFG